MATRVQLRGALIAVCMALTVAWGVARADVPVVTGEHWTKSSDEQKKAYLIGIANVVQVETAYFATNPPTDAQSFVPRFAKGLQAETLDSVKQGLDKWYAANPGRLERPVLETIWFEMVVPGLQKNK